MNIRMRAFAVKRASPEVRRAFGLTFTKDAIISIEGNGVCLPQIVGNRSDRFRADDSCKRIGVSAGAIYAEVRPNRTLRPILYTARGIRKITLLQASK
jgi:hypothetical protein